MKETLFFVAIIGISISLIIAYYVIKYAVIEGLETFYYRNSNSKLEKKLNDIFIQVGGDPIAFEDAEIQSETQFLEESSRLEKSKLSQSKLKIETERLKNDIETDLIRKKIEIVKRNHQ